MQLEAHLRLCQSCLWCSRSGMRLFSHSYAHRKAVNYYDLLGVKPDATIEEIKHAFFDKSKKLHPDSDPSNPALHNQFVALNEAYRVLSKEVSRKEYDLNVRYQSSSSQGFTAPSSHGASTDMDPQDNMRYWEQFRQTHAQQTTTEDWQKRRRKDVRLAGYCIIAIALSLGVHLFIYRRLEEVHNNFMDEKDRSITEMYNQSKMRARVNSFEKQTEFLRQRHAEFVEKYKISNNRQDK